MDKRIFNNGREVSVPVRYEMQELLPVAAWLANRYTARESSSVSYDTARKLMGAAIYCIEEWEEKTKMQYALEGASVESMYAYREGVKIVLDKVRRAREIYHRMIYRFEDYGCRNYRDTILKGMPAFFTRYDASFAPQNHILTLDYPVLGLNEGKSGVDLILEYLKEAEYEQMFLLNFNSGGIRQLLDLVCPDYEELYLDNLCGPVLMRALLCMTADRNPFELMLDEEDYEKTKTRLAGKSISDLEGRFCSLLTILEKGAMKEEYRGCFKSFARTYAVRILNSYND